MNGKRIKKAISKIIFAGLIVSIMPIHLSAQTTTTVVQKKPLAQWQTKKPTSKEINSAIAEIKNVGKKIKITKNILTALAAGGTIVGVSAGIVIAAIGVVLTILFPPTFAALGAGAGLTVGANVIIGGIVTLLVSGALGGALIPIIFGGPTGTQLIHSFHTIETLKKIEQKYPAILTADQLNEVAKFDKTIAGPITKGIVTGIRLNNALKANTTYALGKHPKLVAHMNGSKNANKTMEKYLKKSTALHNITLAMYKIENKINRQKSIKDQHKNKLSWGYHKENTKLIAMKMDIKRMYTKIKFKNLSSDIAKIENKYPILKSLQSIVQKYIQDANAITSELVKK